LKRKVIIIYTGKRAIRVQGPTFFSKTIQLPSEIKYLRLSLEKGADLEEAAV
jgi:hypothetical protein